MSYELYSKYMDAKPIEFNDGHIFVAPASVADPTSNSSVVVICKKHKGKPIPVDYSFFTRNFTKGGLVDAAIDALKSLCEGCIHERGHKTTRFPEGAEL